MTPPHSAVVTAFRALHQSGCFVIPNPWDAGSARYLEHLGFKALATTSAGLAFTRALPDAGEVVSRDVVLENLRQVVRATKLPVNADFQSGYAKDAEGVAASVALCLETGVAGLSIEDATGDTRAPLYERAAAIERVRAARQAIDASGTGVFLTARCEAYLVGHPDARAITIDRLVAFAEAGADCLFAPGVRDAAEISQIVRAVAPKPVNVIVSGPSVGLTVEQLAELGVRRISVGSALARVAWAAWTSAARRIAETGSFDALGSALGFAEFDSVFGGSR